MCGFDEHHPTALTVYFLSAAGLCMFSMDAVLLGLSLLGALICLGALGGMRPWRSHLYALVLFAGMALVNPLVSHRGVTVLFVLNRNPVTLEAVIYGMAAGCMVLAVLYWFRAFTRVMTSEKLLCVFGTLSPKLALLLSMALRYVPLFARQAAQVEQSQRAMGLYREENLIDRIRGGLRIFSVMVTWTLENGIITADSMTARGYGIGRRSRYTVFRWRRGDVLLLGATLALTALTLFGLADADTVYYPAFRMTPLTARTLLGYASYGLLTLLPALITGKEALKWHCLRSRI